MAPPNIDHLRQLLHYDPETGVVTWLKSTTNSVKAGRPVGNINAGGYIELRVAGHRTYAHRIAWALAHGTWPNQIDHINGDRSDNRLCNLRHADFYTNARNRRRSQSVNKSGFKGVCFDKSRNKWIAQIEANHIKYHLGRFDTPEKAHEAYKEAAAKLHGIFANHG